jgi:predicted nucleic acid-binding protein
VSVYLDASVLVALFTHDLLGARADAFLRTHSPVLVVSDFAAAEFASAIARHGEQEQSKLEMLGARSQLSTHGARVLPGKLSRPRRTW